MPIELTSIEHDRPDVTPESGIIIVLVLDLTGTFVFALSGALAGVKRRLDIFGVLVLSFAAANSGGITRDLLIGAFPPPGRRLALCRRLDPRGAHHLPLRGVNRAHAQFGADLFPSGLALFAVAGASKALGSTD